MATSLPRGATTRTSASRLARREQPFETPAEANRQEGDSTVSRSDTDLIMVCTSDIACQLRGKARPRLAIEKRRETDIGWTPTNVFITSFGPIASTPFGALGDLYIHPDFSTQIDLEFPDYGVDESFVIGNLMKLDGSPWECCLRNQLAAAVSTLETRHGCTLNASFEHEFHYSGSKAQPGRGYALRAFRRLGAFPNRLMRVLDAAGLAVDTFMPEYGPGQCEVTIGPKSPLRAADEAAILRELVRATARGLDARASFAPILEPAGVGNGVHVHFSLVDLDKQSICYDSTTPSGVSGKAGAFVAGILKRLPEFVAMTAPTVCSYLRLTPHRWSAAYNNFGRQDREAAVRICPVYGGNEQTARQLHFEYRVADAAASPYLVLAALINAGVSGLEEELETPQVTQTDLSELSPAALSALSCERLPTSLDAALTRMRGSGWPRTAFGATLVDAIDRHKLEEIRSMADLSDEEMCQRYTQAY